MNLDLACNDYRNGVFQGWFESAYVHRGASYEEGLELEGPRTKVKVAELGGTVRIGRVTVPYKSSQSWVGNWCWDSYQIDPRDMLRVLNYLIRRGWHCTCGPTELFERFNEGREITAEEWERLTQ